MKSKNLTEKLSLKKENVSSLGKHTQGKGTGTECWTAASIGGLGVTCLFTMIHTCTCGASGYSMCC
ncbi:MAG: hypothetical protein ACEPOW_03775 [Bacteroidales bacterium]